MNNHSVNHTVNHSVNHSIKSAFGQAVRQHRRALQLSQETLGQRADLHRTYIADIERGARNPSLQTILRIAHGLEVPMTVLFETVKSMSVNGTLSP